MTDKRFWFLVEKIGWGTISTDYRKLGWKLLTLIDNINEINEMKTLSKKFQAQLINKFYDKNWNLNDNIIQYWGGDDSFWDFRAHIVGLGEEFFNSIMKNPTETYSIKDSYVECFDYIFSAAVDYTITEKGKKLLNIKKRKNKLNSILKNENF